MSRRGSLDQDEQDAAEIRKALATGNAKELTGVTSALPPVLCYCTASILMTLVNKFVVSGVDFNMTFLLLAIQLVVCVSCVLLSKQVGLISIRPFDWQNAKAWFPISFMLVSVIYTGSKSLQFLSIPVYTIFKNLTIILIAYGEVIWFGGRVTGLTLVSFLLMALSSVVAAYADVSLATSTTAASPALGNALPDVSAGLGLLAGVVRELNLRKLGIGYFWMMTNCLSNAAFVLAMRKRIKVTGFSDWETMLYNNLLSIPVLVVFSLLFEDWSGANVSRSFPPETRSLLLLTIAFSGAASVGISYTTAWCIRTTSSTTYSMVGALNKLPVAASGMLFFGDVVTFNSVTAIGLGFVAGIVYAVAKSAQKREDVRIAAGVGLPMNHRGLKT